MTETMHQVVKLGRGKHSSPDHGACVMELASMLAGERFSDRPRTVCPVIGAFLRTYNDALDDERRQDLYPYAADAVGTLADADVERRRAERCVEFTDEMAPGSRFVLRRWSSRRRLAAAGELAARAASRSLDERRHARTLRFVRELMAVGSLPGVDDRQPQLLVPVDGLDDQLVAQPLEHGLQPADGGGLDEGRPAA
jgi:hypothetical protein